MKMKLIVESHVPYVPEELARYFDIEKVAPDNIDAACVRDADALIVRTRTRCNAALLAGSRVKFIGTATIGTDHIDMPWCEANGIAVANAPGCNAPAVAQYVYASLLRLFPEGLAGKTIGVVGVGHVGSIVADWGEQLGMKVLCCDPPRAEVEGSEGFVDLEQISAEADIISFHVPHTVDGKHATHHIANRPFFGSLRRRPVIINAARGPIVDTISLIHAINIGIVGPVVMDTWEGEPNINTELLKRVAIATPHIAGYSHEGKVRATTAVVNALCRHFCIDYSYESGLPYLPERVTEQSIAASFDPMVYDAVLSPLASNFEIVRNTYPLRSEVR